MRAEPAPQHLDRNVADAPATRDTFPVGPHDVQPPRDDLDESLEALLLTSSRAMSSARLATLLGAAEHDIRPSVERLNETYAETGRSFRIVAVAGGWRVKTLPRHDGLIREAAGIVETRKLGPGVVEALAIVAYRQPVLRSDIEAIRGTSCADALRTLLDHKLIRVQGRADLPGRPMLYSTTDTLLDRLGLQSLKQLPPLET